MDIFYQLGSFIAGLSPIHVLVGILLVLVLLIAVLLLVQLRNNRELHNLTYPVYDYTVKEAEKRANEIIDEAQAKARSIVAASETEAAKVVGDREAEGERLVAEYEKRLAELMHKNESLLSSYAENARAAFAELNESLKRQTEEGKRALETELKTFAEDTKSTRAALEAETKRLIAEHLEKDFADVRDALATYRRERMRLIDEEIVDIVERAVMITMRKELSLKDHAELVHKSLEEAKREGLFV